jgi:hypothetical protein
MNSKAVIAFGVVGMAALLFIGKRYMSRPKEISRSVPRPTTRKIKFYFQKFEDMVKVEILFLN